MKTQINKLASKQNMDLAADIADAQHCKPVKRYLALIAAEALSALVIDDRNKIVDLIYSIQKIAANAEEAVLFPSFITPAGKRTPRGIARRLITTKLSK